MDDYEVGYGKPPKTTRFAKGKSGNPSGRKKGKLNVVTIFHSVTQATITVTENGKARSITKFEAMLMQMMNKAVAGDLRAMKEVLQWSHLFNQMPDQDAGDGPDTEKSSIVMNQFIEQIRNASIELEVANSSTGGSTQCHARILKYTTLPSTTS